MTSTPALDGAVKSLTDLGKDAVLALQPNQTLAQRLSDFSNLIGDAMSEIAALPNIKTELAGLQPDDYGRLGGMLVTDMGFTSDHAVCIATAAVKLLSDGAVSDCIALVHAIATK